MGAGEIHSIYKVSYLYRMDYICKNKNLKRPQDSVSPTPLPQ